MLKSDLWESCSCPWNKFLFYFKYKGMGRETLSTPLKWLHLVFNIRMLHLNFLIQTFFYLHLAWFWDWISYVVVHPNFKLQSVRKEYFWIFTKYVSNGWDTLNYSHHLFRISHACFEVLTLSNKVMKLWYTGKTVAWMISWPF